jgi:hypothetical protein
VHVHEVIFIHPSAHNAAAVVDVVVVVSANDDENKFLLETFEFVV